LRRRDYKKVKLTCKSEFTAEMKQARLTFCLLYKDWIIEKWKRVIWSNEIIVILNHRRETVKIWRTTTKKRKSVKSTVRVKWAETCEFMSWKCFSYDWKKSCHWWESKTKAEKTKTKIKLDQMN
jgi:hypothetical protein